MPGKLVLVVDDDRQIRDLIRRCLEGEGFSVSEAVDSASVIREMADRLPDLVLLDLALGRENGLDIARSIRSDHNMPIIMVTGKDDVIDRIVGLELGADDYITKPFHVREMLARVRSVMRRSEGQVGLATPGLAEEAVDGTVQLLDGLTIDRDQMSLVDRNGTACDLTTADFKLLTAFLDNPKRPLSRDRLMDLIDGPEWTPLDRAIDNQVARLRKKIERDPSKPALIKTVRGVGYLLTESAVVKVPQVARTA
jgi:DNA-binding response OmpR family regulator